MYKVDIISNKIQNRDLYILLTIILLEWIDFRYYFSSPTFSDAEGRRNKVNDFQN